jgi:hypothetical protein
MPPIRYEPLYAPVFAGFNIKGDMVNCVKWTSWVQAIDKKKVRKQPVSSDFSIVLPSYKAEIYLFLPIMSFDFIANPPF